MSLQSVLSLLHVARRVNEEKRVIVPPLHVLGPGGTWRIRCEFVHNKVKEICSFSRHYSSPKDSVFGGKVVTSLRALETMLSEKGYDVDMNGFDPELMGSTQSENVYARIRNAPVVVRPVKKRLITEEHTLMLQTRSSSPTEADNVVTDPIPHLLYETSITNESIQKELSATKRTSSILTELRRGTHELTVMPVLIGAVSPPIDAKHFVTENDEIINVSHTLHSIVCTGASISDEHFACLNNTLNPDYAHKVRSHAEETPGMMAYEIRAGTGSSFQGGVVLKKYVCKLGKSILPCIYIVSLSVPEEMQGRGYGKILFRDICDRLLFDCLPDAKAGYIFAQTLKSAKFWKFKMDISNVGRCLILQTSMLKTYPETIYRECEPRAVRVEREV